MAVITLDTDKQKIYVLVEEKDFIHTRDGSNYTIEEAGRYSLGRVFVDEKLDVCIIRGER